MINTQFENLSDFLIDWNNFFILDRNYRKKYSIAFNSKEHRNLCYIDIYLEFLEDAIFEQHSKEFAENIEKIKQYNSGKWIDFQRITPEITEKLIEKFDNIDISSFNFQNEDFESDNGLEENE